MQLLSTKVLTEIINMIFFLLSRYLYSFIFIAFIQIVRFLRSQYNNNISIYYLCVSFWWDSLWSLEVILYILFMEESRETKNKKSWLFVRKHPTLNSNSFGLIMSGFIRSKLSPLAIGIRLYFGKHWKFWFQCYHHNNN